MRDPYPAGPSPFPLVATLPAIYQADAVTHQLCSALDRVLAPIIATLDGLPAYFDPRTAPPDSLGWLGSWVGVALGESWPEERRRALIGAAARLHAGRGTRRGIEEALRLATGAEPALEESGGVAYSSDSTSALPGVEGAYLRITVRGKDLADGTGSALRALLALLVPAHVPWELVVR